MNARGLQRQGLKYVLRRIAHFNSCMREDCNSFLFCSSVFDIYFDSCMRENCSRQRIVAANNRHYFDSYMRENCNEADAPEFLLDMISIHACARIET